VAEEGSIDYILTTLCFGAKLRYSGRVLKRHFRMPNRPMSESQSVNSSAARNFSLSEDPALPGADFVSESDFAELAALFAANHGGSFSADLALDVVLHEIAGQACLATLATGAAIVLGREGEMVCRASSGSTAPELGARLDSGAGITGECIRSLQVQSCDDAQADPRADIEASQRLGIRSVMVLPLVRDSGLVGLFEVFSTRAAAFGERDERTLKALAGRVIRNLESADKPPNLVPVASPTAVPITSPERTEMRPPAIDAQFGESDGITDSRPVTILTWALGLTVLACAVWLGALAVERLRGTVGVAHARSAKPASASGGGARVEFPHGTPTKARGVPEAKSLPTSLIDASAGKKDATASFSSVSAATSSAQPSGSHNGRAQGSSIPPGSLRVYENGREVFRMPPSQGQPGVSENAGGSGVQLAASVDQEGAMELSSAAAEASLVHRIEPEYPEEALQQKIQGPVVLDVHISQEGAVQEQKVVSGPPLLAQAAMDAVKQWRFKPRKVNGHLAEMQTKITLNFKLPN